MIKYLLLFLLVLPIVNAAEADLKLYKDKYSAGETFQADININKIPLNEVSLNNLKLVDLNDNEIKVAPFFYKIREGKYFLYFDLPDINGSFRLKIINLLYKEENLITKNFEANFTVEEGYPILTVKPAFFFENDFLEVEVNNKKGDTKIIFNTNEEIKNVYNGEQEILEGRNRFFNFKLLNKLNRDSSLSFNYANKSYSLPIFVKDIIEKQEITNKSVVPFSLIDNINKVERKLYKSDSLEGPLKIKNNLDNDILINFEIDGNLKEILRMNYTSFKIKANETLIQFFWINEKKNANLDFYSGNLTMKYENFKLNIPMSFNFNRDVEMPGNYAENLSQEIFENKTKTFDQGTDFFEENATYYEPEQSKGGIGSLLIMVLVIILAFIIYLFTRKKIKHENFKDYVKTIERK